MTPKLSEPISFRLRFLWTSSFWFRISVISVIAGCSVVLVNCGIVGWLFEYLTIPLVTFDQTSSTLIGVIVGAAISMLVSLYLQRDQYRRDAYLERRDNLYRPLFEDTQALRKQLKTSPFPCFIAHKLDHVGRLIEKQDSFLEWSRVKSDDRIILVPKWLFDSLENFIQMLSMYNEMYYQCEATIERKLVEELKARDLIESASGFKDLRLILLENYDARIIALFGRTNCGSNERTKEFEVISPDLIPDLFREYSELECVTNLRTYYEDKLLTSTDWIYAKLTDLLRYIELKYRSHDSLV